MTVRLQFRIDLLLLRKTDLKPIYFVPSWLPFYAFYRYVKDFTLGPQEKCGQPPAARVLHTTGHTVLAFRTKAGPSAKLNRLEVSIHAKFVILYFEILHSHKNYI